MRRRTRATETGTRVQVSDRRCLVQGIVPPVANAQAARERRCRRLTAFRNLRGSAVTLCLLARALVRRQDGQTLTEYALLLLGLAALVIVAVTAVGNRLRTVFSNVASDI
jgi:Flp pilus assembly pilin Flp